MGGNRVLSIVENTIDHFHPYYTNTMKKILVLCSMIVALGFVVGCPPRGEADKTAPSSTTTGSSDGTTGGNAAGADTTTGGNAAGADTATGGSDTGGGAAQ